MAVITMPAEMYDYMAEFVPGLRTYEMAEVSESNGDTRVRVLAPQRYTFSIRSLQGLPLDIASEWERVLMQLRGRINHLAVWDRMRPTCRGQLRGTPAIVNTINANATQMVLASVSGTGSGSWLQPGDWLQIGSGVGTSQTVRSVGTGNFNSGTGNLTVTFEPPLRQSFTSGTIVNTEQALVYCRRVGNQQTWAARAGAFEYGQFSLDLVEDWTP